MLVGVESPSPVIPVRGERLQAALEVYAKFLRETDSAPHKRQPYLIRRVREPLRCARAHEDSAFARNQDLFLVEVGVAP